MAYRPILIGLSLFVAIFLLFCGAILAVISLTSDTPSFHIGPRIGVVEVYGPIEVADPIVRDLATFRDAEEVRAVILRIDSPGGGVAPSQEIWTAVRETVAVKPVVVSMGSVAASGGYYIAAPATRIFANPGTITGSIGVIMGFTQYRDLLEKIGLSQSVVKSGEFKDIGSAVRPMTEGEEALLQGMIDDVHSQFVEAIVSGRSLPEEQVRELADGRMFSGRQALAVGLVDELGALSDVVKATAGMVEIEGEPHLVYPEPEERHLWDYLLEEAVGQLTQLQSRMQQPGLQFLWNGH